jgi:hypothetical protein
MLPDQSSMYLVGMDAACGHDDRVGYWSDVYGIPSYVSMVVKCQHRVAATAVVKADVVLMQHSRLTPPLI